ncbi:MAG: bifunctional homocysteine S-methyltransferase/methylenetetrahydrofolate reductase [Anaerolineales bacterium]
MPTTPFLERLGAGPLLLDGAMGTSLHQTGLRLGSCLEALCLSDPAIVADVHRRYIEAGADVIETNTFNANDYRLRPYGHERQVMDINEAAVEIALETRHKLNRDDDLYILGSVGPLGVWIAPIGRMSESNAYKAFRKQIATLIHAGVDGIMLETFSDLNELRIAIQVARDVKADIPLVASMTFTRDDRTVLGDAPAAVAEQFIDLGADVVGVNCSTGPAQLLRIAAAMRQVLPPEKFFAVMPNAGIPQQSASRISYPASPDYFGEYALAYDELGVSLMGGCCGTTPAHIHAMRDALDDDTRTHAMHIPRLRLKDAPIEPPSEQPTALHQRLAAGEFVTTVEVAPPRSYTPQRVVVTAQMLRDAGVDFINVSDAPLARMRMSPWAVAYLIQEQAHIETILHFPVRGRNILRVQGDLLAAHALNIRNIFVTMGDPTRIGDYPDSFDTVDVVPTGLVQLLKAHFNQGVDQAGNSLEHPTHFFAGAALNLTPSDDEREKQIKLTRKKIENGADFLLTQPVFDPEAARRFFDDYAAYYGEPLRTPVIAGLLPLYNPRHAAFLHNEVPGMHIPDALRERMNQANDPAAEGVRIAQEILLQVREFAGGAYLMPPFGRYYLAAEVVEVLHKEPT